jgi:pimeloyl-ACP methyl ester carboxylesterase
MQKPAASAHGDLAMFRWDARDGLRSCAVPVLVIGGSKDIVTKPEASRHIAGSTRTGRLQIIADVNHMGPVERAATYHEAIASFADTLVPRGPVAV